MSPGLCYTRSRTWPLCTEATRYTNPLKQKFRAKRLATESGLYITLHAVFLLYL
jgi:hypothetical protein